MSSGDDERAILKLSEEMKVDILTEFQDADNEKTRKEVSRSFTCAFSPTISHGQPTYLHIADTITGLLLNKPFLVIKKFLNSICSPDTRDVCLRPEGLTGRRCLP